MSLKVKTGHARKKWAREFSLVETLTRTYIRETLGIVAFCNLSPNFAHIMLTLLPLGDRIL